MRIILSPAKKMRYDENGPAYRDLPVFLSDAEKIKASLKEKSFSELKALWACNDKIAEQNIERLSSMDLREQLSPAILSYDGIAYQYMAPTVFETEMLRYVQEHLRILSGFYGILKPMDGVTPYRLEMQAKLERNGKQSIMRVAAIVLFPCNNPRLTLFVSKIDKTGRDKSFLAHQ